MKAKGNGMRTLLIAALIVGLSGTVFAQKSPQEENAFLQVQADQKTFLDNLGAGEQDLYDLIQQYMLVRIKNVIDLTNVQTIELMKRAGGYKDQLTRLKFQRGMLIAQLHMQTDGNADESHIAATLDNILANEQQTVVTLGKLVSESGSILSVPQQAQLYLFVGDFEQDIRRMATHAKRIDEQGHSKYTKELHNEVQEFDGNEQAAFRALVEQKMTGLDIQDREQKNIIELVDAWLVVRLKLELELTPEETVLLFAKVGTHKDQLHEMKWLIADARSELRNAILAEEDDSLIQGMLDDMLLREQAVVGLVKSFIGESQKSISIARSAQLFLFLGEFELEVIDLIEVASSMNAQD